MQKSVACDMPTVKELLLHRLGVCKLGDFDDSKYHLALVIEGGGMRGVVSGGMVTALEKMHSRSVFDSVHGSSAGACAAVYFMAGQAEYGTSIYYEDINNKQFINIKRLFLGKPIMDASFLIDYVMQKVKALDTSNLLKQRNLFIACTNIEKSCPVFFNKFNDKFDFFNKLKASIYMPLIAGKYICIDGKKYCDGGVTQPIPVLSAVQAGATHILMLMTHKADNMYRRPKGKAFSVEKKLLSIFYDKNFAKAYIERGLSLNKYLDYSLNAKRRSGFPCIDFVVRPSDATYISRLETDKKLLMAGAREGEQAIYNYIESRN